MKRRDFLSAVGVATLASPRTVRAQQARALPTIGFLGANSASAQRLSTDAFVQRLRELGWIDGRTVSFAYRWAEGRFERAPALIAELIEHKIDVLLTHSGANITAAKQATSVIPIVFAAVGDPVGNGYVESLARPGGNITGISLQANDLAGKRIELIREAIPAARRVAFLSGSNSAGAASEVAEFQFSAKTLGIESIRADILKPEDMEPVIEQLKGRVDALYVQTIPILLTNRERLNALALAARLPAFAGSREFAEASGLMSYGPNFPDLFRQAGGLVDKILRGAKPASLPVEQPTKFELVVNLATAKALGLTLSPLLLARADDVIE